MRASIRLGRTDGCQSPARSKASRCRELREQSPGRTWSIGPRELERVPECVRADRPPRGRSCGRTAAPTAVLCDFRLPFEAPLERRDRTSRRWVWAGRGAPGGVKKRSVNGVEEDGTEEALRRTEAPAGEDRTDGEGLEVYAARCRLSPRATSKYPRGGDPGAAEARAWVCAC